MSKQKCRQMVPLNVNFFSSVDCFFKKRFILNYGYTCGCAHMNAGAPEGKKRPLEPLETELQEVVSHLMGT